MYSATFVSAPAFAAPEEIQVYMDELDKPGEIGLDVHSNYVATGDRVIDYPGAQVALHRLRITPEFSYGLSSTLELGAYLPLTTLDGSGTASVDGAKVRIKYLAPRAVGQRWFWAANFEIGRVGHKLDENPWNAEFKAIGGIRSGPWTLAANANVDFKISGPASAPASLEIDTKLSHHIGPSSAIGIESYNGLGAFAHLGRFGASEQSSYVTLDSNLGRWDVNFGVGHGYGANSDGWIVKAVIGVPI